MSLSDTEGEVVAIADNSAARLAVARHACALFWAHGVTGTSGDDIADAARLSTRTIWRYFRSKESCVEPVLAKSLDRFLAVVDRWPAELSLGEHLAADAVTHPLTPQDIDDEISAMRIATMTASEPALRTAYLMVHDEMERGLIPVVAKRLCLSEDDLIVRLCAAAVTGALRVIDLQPPPTNSRSRMTLPEIIPVEQLFDSPVRAGASISPDGTKIAYLAPWKNRLNVWVQTIDSDVDDSRCVTADDNRSVYIHQWTDDPI